MSDLDIRVQGRAGRITLTRPKALNALSYDMCLALDAALKAWRDDDRVALIILDAEGEKAFCAGGDIAQLYDTGTAGDYGYARRFWRDEYRMNARLAEYPKPVVSLMQGFVMGGGVGIGCHGSHRVVGDSTRIAMPETGIGLVPNVGGSLLLAGAPGRLGEYLGLTAARMGPGDAIRAGFADHYLPEQDWPGLVERLCATGELAALSEATSPAPEAVYAAQAQRIDRIFGAGDITAIRAAAESDDSDFARDAAKALNRNSPLSMALTLDMLGRLRPAATIRDALRQEYRATWRVIEHGDFLEGIRAQIIDKDRNPKWRYADAVVPASVVTDLLVPLGEDELTFD